MEINELAKALRTIMGNSSGQLALASLGGDGQSSVQLPAEFSAAARSLAGRQDRSGNQLLSNSTQAWI